MAVPSAPPEWGLEPLLESRTRLPRCFLALRPRRRPKSATTTTASSGSRGSEVHSIQWNPGWIFRRKIDQHRRQRCVVLEVIEHDLVERVALGMPGDRVVVPGSGSESE